MFDNFYGFSCAYHLPENSIFLITRVYKVATSNMPPPKRLEKLKISVFVFFLIFFNILEEDDDFVDQKC